MINLSKFIAIIISVICFASAYAGEALIFDDPGLVAFHNGSVISGMYSMENDRFGCIFLFFENGPTSKVTEDKNFSDTKILTFVPDDKSFLFAERDATFDIAGDLYRHEDEWSIRTSRGQAGCENATGLFMSGLGGNPGAIIYNVTEKIHAIGIRLVARKTYFHEYSSGEFVKRKGYLTKWNGVVVLQTRGQFSYVRFIDARLNAASLGRVTTGWIRTVDLVNPFPSNTGQ